MSAYERQLEELGQNNNRLIRETEKTGGEILHSPVAESRLHNRVTEGIDEGLRVNGSECLTPHH